MLGDVKLQGSNPMKYNSNEYLLVLKIPNRQRTL
jgi:hypothetical protein